MAVEQGPIWVTGAGSGMGQAAAVALAAGGRTVVLSGRRIPALESTAAQVRAAGGRALVQPLDVTDRRAAASAHAVVVDQLGPVSTLVLAAGLNAPRRYWSDQQPDETSDIVSTNLLAVMSLVGLTLPAMRERRRGTVVLVSSYSGWRFSPDAGVAYSASKTALGSVAEMLNHQENKHGVRACHLCPGDVDSDFLSLRPNVPDAPARTSMLTPEDVARAVTFVVDSPPGVTVNELVITPTKALG